MLGRAVDERLEAGDVRLTMGGEPTFVAVDDMDAPEWNVDADGEDKRARAAALARRLLAKEARPRCGRASRPGQVVSGRTVAPLGDRPELAADEQPIWRDPALLDDPWGRPCSRRDRPRPSGRGVG